MTRRNTEPRNLHGPENAEHEIRKAYNCVIDSGMILAGSRLPTSIPASGARHEQVVLYYKHAYRCYRNGNKLAAERWARTAKHLARAFFHEAKIAYLEPRAVQLPFLEGAHEEDYHVQESPDTTADLLDSLAEHIPADAEEVPREMMRYLQRGRKHLAVLNQPDYRHELLRVERVKAAHEYGRAIECMSLAYEVDKAQPAAAA